MQCHYCGSEARIPSQCPQCATKSSEFIKKGIGTQQLVKILSELFPSAKVGRADLDITKNKALWAETLEEFESGKINILVGTQTIARGFHFPNVNLVGVLWADMNVHFPTFSATETALQQLIQVAGRAGRQSSESTVIVQAMESHDIFNYVNERDYMKFYKNEIDQRELVGYPPSKRLVEIELKNTAPNTLANEARKISETLRENARKYGTKAEILGPVQPLVHKIKDTHIQRIYLKGPSFDELSALFKTLNLTRYASSIFFTPNPVA